ncbi:diacylglycerol kinase family protein [Jeotgalibacillus sp. R-1-5s-1]|nr:diacylglycerol kinase family protein [Jeotgalibacillus sp. R-1-5s-1]TFD92528.1 diacylglycerol kinase family protein [Jeotgalibacillus sp. R-1-5s-1]
MDVRKLIRSFRYAASGVKDVFLNEQNFKIHTVAGLAMIVLAFILKLNGTEWLILLLFIGGVLALELMNTAIERTVDLVTEELHPLAKKAKDAAAASVLFFAIAAAIGGLILFVPKLFAIL